MLLTENYKDLKIAGNKLQSFGNNVSVENPRKESSGFWKFFKGVIDDFVENCTIPGLDRIFKSNLKSCKRFLWLCGFTIAILMFAYVSSSIANIQKTTPLITVVSTTHMPIFKIPFPEITICNKNRLNWQRYGLAKEKFLLPKHQSFEYEEIFMEVLNAYDTLSFGKFEKFENLLIIPTKLLEELNYINFTLVVEFMAWKCDEIFSECRWINQHFNCCEIFFVRKSQMGSCLAFNSIESNEGIMKQSLDRYWPWRSKGMGIDNGLRVKVHINENLHIPISRNLKGIMFMVAEPYVWYYNPIEVSTHTRTTVSFSAILHYFDNYTRYYSSDIRQCLFEDELNSLYYKSLHNHRYMFENCQAQCQQEYLLRFCNCTMDLFYPPGPYRPCKLTDFPCLYKHNDKFQYFEDIGERAHVLDNQTNVMNCMCYFNCKSLTYITNFNSAYMSNEELDSNNTYIDISFYFLWDFIMVFQTTVKYTWTDLMSGLGGLAGLCVGCSLISLVELLYFFLVDIPKHIILYFNIKKHFKLYRKSQDVKVIVVDNVLRK